MSILAAAALLASLTPAADRCSALFPAALAEQVRHAYPGYRLPASSDDVAEEVEYNLERGGSGCLGVGAGDFDGDGKSDYVLALGQVNGTGLVILVALSRADHWDLHKLQALPDGRAQIFVGSDAAGTFERFEGFDSPPEEEGEVETLNCPHDAVVFGTVQASAVVYCFTEGKWQHTWVSD